MRPAAVLVRHNGDPLSSRTSVAGQGVSEREGLEGETGSPFRPCCESEGKGCPWLGTEEVGDFPARGHGGTRINGPRVGLRTMTVPRAGGSPGPACLRQHPPLAWHAAPTQVARSNKDLESRVLVRAREEERALRRRAAWIGKEVMSFWEKAGRVVAHRRRTEMDARKKEIMDKQVGQGLGGGQIQFRSWSFPLFQSSIPYGGCQGLFL